MGIDFRAIVKEFEYDKFDHILGKVLSGCMEHVHRVNDQKVEINFDENSSEPDVIIQVEKSGMLFTYNGGYHHSWAVFGAIISLMAEHFSEVSVSEV